MKKLELIDHKFYIIKDLFNKMGTINYFVNDKTMMPSSCKYSTEENMILEIYDAVSPYFEKRINDNEANFKAMIDKGDILKYIEKNKLDSDPNIAFMYSKKINSFIEPFSNMIVRIYDNYNIEDKTEKSIRISPIAIQYNGSGIMMIRLEDISYTDNIKYKDAFQKYNKDSKRIFDERFNKYLNVEHVIARIENENYGGKTL